MVDVEALRAIHVADVIEQAVQAKQVSYSPYRYVGCDLRSSFRVGAALLLEDGTIIVGANVENASYGVYRVGLYQVPAFAQNALRLSSGKPRLSTG